LCVYVCACVRVCFLLLTHYETWPTYGINPLQEWRWAGTLPFWNTEQPTRRHLKTKQHCPFSYATPCLRGVPHQKDSYHYLYPVPNTTVYPLMMEMVIVMINGYSDTLKCYIDWWIYIASNLMLWWLRLKTGYVRKISWFTLRYCAGIRQ